MAGAERTLKFIGWQHAEPVLRSLAYALLMHEEGNPAQRDAEADRPWRQHSALVKRLSGDLSAGNCDDGATRELLATLRSGSYAAAAAKIVEVLNRGVAVQSVWDAIFCGAGELLLCQPGIVALHAVTTTNAMHYAFQASGDPETRRMLLLRRSPSCRCSAKRCGGTRFRRRRRRNRGRSSPRRNSGRGGVLQEREPPRRIVVAVDKSIVQRSWSSSRRAASDDARLPQRRLAAQANRASHTTRRPRRY